MNVIDRYREGEPVELCEGELLTPGGTCKATPREGCSSSMPWR